MDDLISRQAAIDAMTNTLWHYPNECYRNLNEYEFAKGLAELGLKSVPSVQPEPQWIPCSERLPEDDTLMLVNYIDHRPDAMEIWIGWHEMENVWYIDGEAHSREFDNDVIAWMPLPEPHKGEKHDE